MLLALPLVVACASAGPSPRMLHELDGEIVYSRPANAVAYRAYLAARLAMETEPRDLELAENQINVALRYDPREPHLWTTRASIEHARGDTDAALASLQRALELRPDYPPARSLLVTLGGPNTASR